MTEEFVAFGEFDHFTEIHHADFIRKVFHYGKIMRDEQYRKPEFIPEIVKQIDNLRLNRHVERGNGFVGYYHVGIHHDSPGNAYSLSLSARELVRVTPRMFSYQTDGFQNIVDFTIYFFFIPDAVYDKPFGDNLPYGHPRIERRYRILKYHLNAGRKFRAFRDAFFNRVFFAKFFQRLFVAFGGGEFFRIFLFEVCRKSGGVIGIAAFSLSDSLCHCDLPIGDEFCRLGFRSGDFGFDAFRGRRVILCFSL